MSEYGNELSFRRAQQQYDMMEPDESEGSCEEGTCNHRSCIRERRIEDEFDRLRDGG